MELCKGTFRDRMNELINVYLNSDPSWLNPSKDQKLPEEYVRKCKIIAWQILNAVAVCHSRGIVHRDLKPANVLWGKNDELKIADFGLARFVRNRLLSESHTIPQTGEVQTMWYRAPEVLLGDEKYGMLIDDWSVGCIIAEMFRFRMSSSNKRMEPDPLFPGRGDVHTYMLITESLGSSDSPYLRRLPYYSSLFPDWKSGNLRQKLSLLDNVGYSLVTKLLAISPQDRVASRYLLSHKWFNDIMPKVSQFVPWYRGIEEEFLRLLQVEKLPDAKPLSDVIENDENTFIN